ncbi:GNAT family N-acetyltransferase [Paenibacillus crassostreae]|uniref:GNAT family acetyltransferase n=1 Tax=Paenibacillus crassostreae TaxID=1763538 RepID=A0A167FTK3_9BACL|nr:GNAT family N-acetyltransferase [Paenibacillus crassostreae]AOZ94078.1 GNAT family N-acetyltransferase [Paenibacillus crassostreae]OAB76886.1 GNAT family acetyltransferase [Paenibacillus crassostreae]
MIRLCRSQDVEVINQIINDAATAYKGIIPEDRYQEPYMDVVELQHEINEGVVFWGYVDANDQLVGVMGIQDKGEVSLIRHAYVRTNQRNSGIGSKLLNHIICRREKPILIGTWESAVWAIKFYEKNGFNLASVEEKERLLRKHWNIPERQIQTSVVLHGSKLEN